MFTHLLVPTDGSDASEAAIRQSIEIAQLLKARVTGLHVLRPFHLFSYQPDMLEDTREQFDQDSQRQAAEFLAVIERAAEAAGVPCETLSAAGDSPYEVILKTAEEQGCDLIAMASHGRRGVKGFLLGSETQKVLAHTHKPVLVFR